MWSIWLICVSLLVLGFFCCLYVFMRVVFGLCGVVVCWNGLCFLSCFFGYRGVFDVVVMGELEICFGMDYFDVFVIVGDCEGEGF